MTLRSLGKGRSPGILIGLALTAFACVLHTRRPHPSEPWLTDHVEMPALDFHLRRFRHIPPSDKILHIDIDNQSIDRWGRWPWPRDTLAGLIGTLDECGADTIILDIILPDPEEDQYRDATRSPYADLTGDVATLGVPNEVNWVRPDKMLAATIREAGSVFVGVDYDHEGERQAADSVEQLDESLRGEIAPILRARFSSTPTEVLRRLEERGVLERYGAAVNLDRVRTLMASAKRSVARDLVRALCEEDPGISYAEVHDRILDTPITRDTADKKDVEAAFAWFESLRRALTHFPPMPEGLKGKLRQVREFTPPWHEFGAVARGLGSVVFDHGQVGGVVREQVLMVEHEGRLIRQIGFAVVCDYLGIRDEEMSIDAAGNLIIAGRGERPALRVPLSEERALLVNWHHALTWGKSFKHIPAVKALELFSLRGSIRDNERKIEILHGEVANAFLGAEEKQKYLALEERIVATRLKLRDREYDGAPADELSELRAVYNEVLAARNRADRELSDFVQANYEAIAGAEPQDDDERQAFEEIRAAHEKVVTRVGDLRATNADLADDIEQTKAELTEWVQGKICVVGYAATALADYMVTPLYGSVPGAMMHSNIINNFLHNDFVRKTPDRLRARVTALIGLAGIVTVVVTLLVGPVPSLTFVLALMMTYAWVHAAFIWERGDLYLASVVPVATIFVNWAFVTLYRQLTEERSKRHVAKALGQYTSPAIAQNIVEASTDLSPQEGVVTCFFSDLAGFTTISETLGAERTKAILNPYLEAMSDVLIDHGAMINKFIGDAVFAFFNPPLFACPQHARAACESAIDSMAALERLKTGDQYPELKEDLQRLYMRIGVNSGPVFVGDYGSENKLDYTCIGDTVNLAARLEPANKVFGTWVMISESTYADANGGFEVRHLGGLQVKGKAQVVQVYELLGRAGQLGDEPRRYAEMFGAAVAKFQRRDFTAAESAFLACLELRSGDPGVKRYLSILEQYKNEPPPNHWNGAIELTEK